MTMNEFMKNGTQEQKEKLRTCKTSQEVLTLAKELGISLDKKKAGEISDEELEVITGGINLGYRGTSIGNPYRNCPICGASAESFSGGNGLGRQKLTCTVCGYVIKEQK
jgi:rubrerythrin